jgi:hypothetical protein
MLNSYLKNKKGTRYLDRDPFSLPLQSHKGSSKKYQTPYKSYNATNVTRNASLSLYSFTSNKRAMSAQENSKKKENFFERIKGNSKQRSASASVSYKAKARKG